MAGVNGSGAIPFTQVWIRPQIDDQQAGFTTVPDSGTAAQTLSWLPQNNPQTFNWGVVGVQKVADPDPDNDAPAHTLVQVGNEMFVGGKFAAVQNGAAARSTTNRGSRRSTYRPVTGSPRSGPSSTARYSASPPHRTATSSSPVTSPT